MSDDMQTSDDPTTLSTISSTEDDDDDMDESSYTPSIHETFNAYANMSTSRDASKVKLAAVASAITETVFELMPKSKSSTTHDPTASEYYATLQTALSSTKASSSHTLELLKLLQVTIGHGTIPQTFLMTQVPTTTKVLMNVYKFVTLNPTSTATSTAGTSGDNEGNSTSNAVIRSLTSIASSLLLALPLTDQTFTQPNVIKLFHIILSSFDDRRPKVRKSAHACVLSVLGLHATSGVTSLAEHVTVFVLAVLRKTTANNTSQALHVFSFLEQTLHLLPVSSIESLTPALLDLVELDVTMVTNNVLTSLLYMSQNTSSSSSSSSSSTSRDNKLSIEFLTSLLTTLLKTTYANLHKTDTPSLSNYARLVTSLTSKLHGVDVKECMKVLPATISVLILTADSSNDDVTTICIAEVRRCIIECLPVRSLRASDSASGSVGVVEKVVACVRKVVGVKFQRVFGKVLPLIGFLFNHWNDTSSDSDDDVIMSLLYPLLKDMITLHTSLQASNKSGAVAIKDAVGQAVEGLGIVRFLSVISLSSDDGDRDRGSPIDKDKIWLLPLLKSRCAQTTVTSNTSLPSTASLSFFQTTILTLARKVDTASSQPSLTAVETANLKARVVDLWSLFPAFCANPSDVVSAFEGLAPTLMKALKDGRYPGLLLVVCAGLRVLVNGVLVRAGKGADAGSGGDGDSIVVSDDAMKDEQCLVAISTKVLPALFNMVEVLADASASVNDTKSVSVNANSNTSEAQKLIAVTDTVAAWARIAPKAFLNNLFKKIMQKLLAATQVSSSESSEGTSSTSNSNSNDDKICNLLNLAVSLIETLDTGSVSLLYRSVKPLIRTDVYDAGVQKRAYKVLLGLCEFHGGVMLAGAGAGTSSDAGTDTSSSSNSNAIDIIELVTGSLMTVHVSARNMRLRCLKHIILTFSSANSQQMSVIPSIIGEVMLCLKDSNKKTRESGYEVLLAMAKVRDDIMDFYQIIVAAYAASTPHMRSAAVMALSRVVFEYARTCEVTQSVLPDLLKATLMLFREKAREVIKAVVGFVRICVAALTPDQLEPIVPNVIEGLMKWNHGKDRFRAKIKIILKKLVVRYGFDFIKTLVPEEDTRLLTHIRKISERQARKKAKNRENENENAENDGKSMKGGGYEEMMDSDEEDSDGGKTLMTGMTGFTALTAKSGKTLKSIAMSQSEKSAAKSVKSVGNDKVKGGKGSGEKEGIMIKESKNGNVFDLLDQSMSHNLKYVGGTSGYNDDDDNSDSDGEVMEFDDDGRLVVNDGSYSDDDDNGKKEVITLAEARKSQAELSKNSSGPGGGLKGASSRMKYDMDKEKSSAHAKKKQRTTESNTPGLSFKSKKAGVGGDVYRKDAKFEPYAYIPLDGKMYTKKHRQGAVDVMGAVVKGKGGGKRKR